MGEIPERERVEVDAGDYFLLYTVEDCFTISGVMAKVIDRQLERWLEPAWIKFVTLNGARVRVRTDRVTGLVQCSKDQRSAARAFQKALREETEDDVL